ncbi:MAG: lysophospholipid acyltransferase family protein [Anaerolineales bacterium]
MLPRYPFPWRIAIPLMWDIIWLRERDFPADARACTGLLSPPLKILNPKNIPAQGPALLVTNHYARPGFQAWWIALAISASVPLEVHWMMTNAWTFLGPLTPLSHWILTRLADVYGFTASPAMPPKPEEIDQRARAVRHVLKISHSPAAVIALAPEGRDQPGGLLGPFPPGAGRFIEKIAQTCQPIIPIGIYEEAGALCLRFGSPFNLPKAVHTSAEERDQLVGQQVFTAIAGLLPKHLHGNSTAF